MASPAFWPGPAKGRFDPSSQAGARVVAEQIRQVWRGVGYEIRVDIDSFGVGQGRFYSARIVEPVRVGVWNDN
jgi:hypothetical protein